MSAKPSDYRNAVGVLIMAPEPRGESYAEAWAWFSDWAVRVVRDHADRTAVQEEKKAS